MFYDNKRHSPEVHEWCYHMMNDSEYFEKWRFKDTMNDYNSIIEELEKLYEQTPVTQRYTRARIQSGLKKLKRELAKTQAEYDKFKEYKARTAISK
jgi:ElaB/YqjD/DUF883 family membrane-anchored ribosome-binding protein